MQREAQLRSQERRSPEVPHQTQHIHVSPEILLKPAVVIGLLGIALIHFLDVFDKFKETPYLGLAYVGLIAGCLTASALLLRRDARSGWGLSAAASLGTLIGFVLSRTTGLPHATGDIGNWMEPLGLASVFVEALVATVSVSMFAKLRRR